MLYNFGIEGLTYEMKDGVPYYTDEIKKYTSKLDTSSNKERNGCVVATKELTDILQLLMDKYTFAGVDNSWTKLCYYYDYLGPEK